MAKKYTNKNVYEALQERLKFIFEEFDNIIVSFSGGKDSSLLLNLTLDFGEKYYPEKRIAVYHQDFEAQYTVTTEYVERTFERIKDKAEVYWVCLPAATRTALSSYQMFWYPWDDTKTDQWVRPMPAYPYVINLENNPITTYKYKMPQEELGKQFARWYKKTHGNKKTVCLLGIRTDESLNRYSGIMNKKYYYKDEAWLSIMFKDLWSASPLYDWSYSDVWHANQVFGYDYNRIYDLFYMAGLKPELMRVASPFNDQAKESLHLYRVIDSDVWTKLLGRVRGANFTAIYGKTKALGYRGLKLPDGYTWKEYTEFLLNTLPARLRNNYVKKFNTSIKFWTMTGGGLEQRIIDELLEKGYKVRTNGYSNYTVMKQQRVIFEEIPDDTDDIKTSKDIPSWKRMCYCILRNDHTCKFMGFSVTKEQQERIDILRGKYLLLGDEKDEK